MKTISALLSRNALLPSAAALGLLLTGGCDDAYEPSQGSEDLSFRSASTGLSVVQNKGGLGRLCFGLEYQCENPEQMTLTQDGEQIASHVPQFEGDGIEDFPTLLCFNTDDLPKITRTYVMTETCGGSDTTASVAVKSKKRGFGIVSVTPDAVFYEAGDTITFDIVAKKLNYTITADFSAVDSGYSPGDEVFIDNGDKTYSVSYTLSSANYRSSGDYDIPIIVSKGGTNPKSQTFGTTLRYLPSGTHKVNVQDGYYSPEPPRTDRTLDLGLRIESVSLVGSVVTPDPIASTDDPPVDFDGSFVEDHGQKVQVTFSSPGRIPLGSAYLSYTESGNSGEVIIPGKVSSASCDAYKCIYTQDVWMNVKGNDPITPSTSWKVVTGETDGPAFPSQPTLNVDSLPVDPLHRVKGDIRFQYVNLSPDFLNPISGLEHVRYGIQETIAPKPAGNTQIQIKDGCGMIWTDWTDSEGHFDFTYTSSCENDDAEIRVFSYTGGARKAAAFEWLNVAAFQQIGDLTTNDSDYALHAEDIATFKPVDGPYSQGQDLGMLTISAENGNDPNELAVGLWILEQAKRTYAYWAQIVDLDTFQDRVGNQLNFHYNHQIEDFPDTTCPPNNGDQSACEALSFCKWHPAASGVEADGKCKGPPEYNQNLSQKDGFFHIHHGDGWSDFAIVHEISHELDQTYFRGLTTYGYGRWGEPMANTLAASVLRDPYMYAPHVGGGYAETMEINGNRKSGDPAGVIFQAELDFHPNVQQAALDCENHDKWDGTECCDVRPEKEETVCDNGSYQDQATCQGDSDCEWLNGECFGLPNDQSKGDCVMTHSGGWDWRIFYDLIDDDDSEPIESVSPPGDPNNPIPYPDFDEVSGNMESQSATDDILLDVVLHYLGSQPENPNYDDRGMWQKDLVDLLDGMVCRGHISEAGADELLHDMMDYQYDFEPTNPSCPN